MYVDDENGRNGAVSLPKEEDARETTRDDAFATFLTDEAFHDLSLESTDGVIIRVNRCALAARNRVFRAMLMGSFREGNRDRVELGFKSDVVQAVVEYLHTDTAKLLNDSDNIMTSDNPFRALALTSLTRAALFFDLPNLCRKAYSRLVEDMKQTPLLALVVMEACYGQAGFSIPHELKEEALSYVRSGAIDLKSSEHVGSISRGVLESILEDDQTSMNEFELFELLVLWTKAASDRDLSASEMTRHINLERIHPACLSSTVKDSGLVNESQLLEAFERQALALIDGGDIDFQAPRHNPQQPIPRWNKSLSSTFRKSTSGNTWETDVLKTEPISSGKYEWTVELTCERVDDCMAGVMLQSQSYGGNFYLGQKGWGYYNAGAVFTAGNEAPRAALKCGSGSKASLTLNLSESTNGVLSVSIDGAEVITICGDMKKYIANGEAFVPCASVFQRASLKLVDFKKLG